MTKSRRNSRKDRPYLECPECVRSVYASEKIHCWICPLCRHILQYKDVKDWIKPLDGGKA